MLVELDLAAPAVDARSDLIVGAVVVVDGSFKQQLCLALRAHLIEVLNLMFREHVGGSWFWLALQAQKLRDLFPRRSRFPGAEEECNHQH